MYSLINKDPTLRTKALAYHWLGARGSMNNYNDGLNQPGWNFYFLDHLREFTIKGQ